jgi:hypothetical protein
LEVVEWVHRPSSLKSWTWFFPCRGISSVLSSWLAKHCISVSVLLVLCWLVIACVSAEIESWVLPVCGSLGCDLCLKMCFWATCCTGRLTFLLALLRISRGKKRRENRGCLKSEVLSILLPANVRVWLWRRIFHEVLGFDRWWDYHRDSREWDLLVIILFILSMY